MTTVSGALPFAILLLLAPLIAWRGRRRGTATPVIAAQLLLAAWVAAIVSVTLFPLPWRTTPGRPIVVSRPGEWPLPWASITPFATIGMSLNRGFGSLEGRVLIGNLVAFVPLGLLVPVVAPRWRSAARILVLGLMASTAVELAQLGWNLVIGMPWRSADIDDVIVNTAGALLGYALWRAAAAVRGRRRLLSSA
ncbi:MAG TPA: VanZ family protein [Candidatus Limnocylindrales bacterium]|jgi:glycopeptide antibiotics resistance protein